MNITASKLYDYLSCPHRVWRDIYGPQEEKSKAVNPFIQLLWDRGIKNEKKVVSKIGDFLDISKGPLKERFNKTVDAMKKGTSLIYQPVLMYKNIVGIPDLLSLNPDRTYIPIDIKSGMGYEGNEDEEGDDDRLKPSYALQLALYVDALRRLGHEHNFKGIIIDIRGNEVLYDLKNQKSPRDNQTWWEYYKKTKPEVEALLKNEIKNKPAISSKCKLCPWYESCKKWAEKYDDPTAIFYLGRSKRDTLCEDLNIIKVEDILVLDVENALRLKKGDKEFLKGVGEKTLLKTIARANVLRKTKKPVIYKRIKFPDVESELFFDIEDDPTQEFVYMHGIYKRSNSGEEYIHFTTKKLDEKEEREVWSKFWEYMGTLPADNFSLYYYSPHEKSTYKKLQKKYPEIITEGEIDNFFANPNVIDLYQIVLKHTDWPVSSYSLKSLAQYLKFEWRDKTPSGALSIQWFNKYIETKDDKLLKRILLYNEDDCKATMVLKDAIAQMSDKL